MRKQLNNNQRLDLIAKRVYGNEQAWKTIRQRNGFTMPFGPQLKAGMIIQIPDEV